MTSALLDGPRHPTASSYLSKDLRSVHRRSRYAYHFKLRKMSQADTDILPADLIQDMYLKELRAYKVPQAKPSDAEGHVQKFNAPKPPKSPEEADLTAGIKAYEDAVVEVEGQSSTGAEAPVEDGVEEEPEEEKSAGGH